MKQRLTAAALVALACLLAVPCFGQYARKNGLTGASILKVGVGARAVALGSAATTFSGDVNQFFWNPAGINLGTGKTQATFSYNHWIADLSHNAFAVSHNFGSWGTFALGGIMAGVSDIEANRDVVPGLPGVTYNTSDTFDYGSLFVGLSYAKAFTDRLTLGASAKYYQETIDKQSANAVAFDFGVIYMLGYKDLALGARINNVGSDIKYYSIAAGLPMVFSFGISMSAIQGESFNLKGFVDATKPLDSDQLVFAGGEATILKAVAIRGGYKFNYSGTTDTYGNRGEGWYDEKTYNRTDEGVTLGAGVEIPYHDYKLVLDYAYTEFDILSNVNRFSLTLTF